MIQKFTISRDDSIYEAFPDVALTPSGKLVCVFAECAHHVDRSYTRIMVTESTDRGRTWGAKRPLTEATSDLPWYNCPRISRLGDGRLVVLVDRIHVRGEDQAEEHYRNCLYFSEDEGATWSDAVETPALGIVPDKLLELASGRWILACQHRDADFGYIVQRLWYSDDQGDTWSGPVIVGRQEGLNLCEVSILPITNETLVAFHRENSGQGWDCYKTISHTSGECWSEPIRFPLPGCHRPVAGWLQDGRIMITHRYMQGGRRGFGHWTQNFFAAVTDRDSALALKRSDAWARILPVDFDRSPLSDIGYSGWAQYPDGEIYIVNYLVDDAPKGQIRGYSLRIDEFLLD